MIQLSEIRNQLSSVGYHPSRFQRAEVKELCQVLSPDERIIDAVNGRYEGGFALLVATDRRLLLVDRKPMFLTLDSITYSMIQELSLTYRLLNSTVHVFTSNKCLDFNSWSHSHLRSIFSYSQSRTLQFRFGNEPASAAKTTLNYMPEFTKNISPARSIQVGTDYPKNQISEIDSEELAPDVAVPTMPLPTQMQINRNMVRIAKLGLSTLGLMPSGNPLAAYKIPGLAHKRFMKNVSIGDN